MSFTALESTDFVISADSITAPAWSSNQPTLTQFFTASTPTSSVITSDAFYVNTYQTIATSNGAAVQFSIAYGNALGSGSKYYNPLVIGVSPSLTTYKQYKTLIYGTAITGSEGFNFGGLNTNSRDAWIINVDRNRYKESLFPGTFNLKLSGSAVAPVHLTDNSNDTSVISYLDCGRVFTIVSGSDGRAVGTAASGSSINGQTISGSYGLFLPDIGTIILNPRALALPFASGGIGLVADETANPSTPYSSVSNTLLFNALNSGSSFQLNSQETVSSNYVFVRIKNAEYNYTSNPTFISGSGDIVYSTLINSPQTYVTTVGLYNNSSELIAVGKLSRPLVKDFTKEALVRVKLDW